MRAARTSNPCRDRTGCGYSSCSSNSSCQLRQWKSVRVGAAPAPKGRTDSHSSYGCSSYSSYGGGSYSSSSCCGLGECSGRSRQCCQVMGRHHHRLPCFHPHPWGDQYSKQLLQLPQLHGQEGSELLSVTAQLPHEQFRLMEDFPLESLRSGPMNTALAP